MTVQLINLDLSRIDCAYSWNLHPYLENEIPKALERSISKIGVLHPPIVIQTGTCNYALLSGRKRICCAKKNGITSTSCIVLPSTSSPKTRIDYLIEDQSAPLTVPEAAHFFRICFKHLGKEEAVRILPAGFSPVMYGIPLDKLAQLDLSIQKSIHYGAVSEKILVDLFAFNRESQKKIVAIIESLQLGSNKQKRFVAFCKEIELREGSSILGFFNENSFVSIIEHSKMNNPQKAARLFELLARHHSPRNTLAMEHFSSQIKKLCLPDNFTLTPSPFFEKDEVTLSIRFKDLDACCAILPILQSALPKH